MSPYPPRYCGVAAYTHDLAAAVGDREIVAIVGPEVSPPAASGGVKPPKVPTQIEIHHRMRRDERADHDRTARDLSRCADVVSVQFDPGTWGGEDGSFVLDFVRALEIPSVTTLHAPAPAPSAHQRAIVTELVSRSAATVVLSESGAARVVDAYGLDPSALTVIPHGILDLPLVDSEVMKPTLELEGRDVILGFGLLGPGKGVELALAALPTIVAARPGACYVVVGATHADMVTAEGDAYRASLLARVRGLGLAGHVRFVDRFVGRVELTRWLEAADVFLAPYPDLDKTVSGTIAYAMGAGRATVSTPNAYAREMLADGRGVVAPSASPADLAAEVIALLEDPGRRSSIGRAAYDRTRHMVWSEVGQAHRRLFASVASARPAQAASASRSHARTRPTGDASARP